MLLTMVAHLLVLEVRKQFQKKRKRRQPFHLDDAPSIDLDHSCNHARPVRHQKSGTGCFVLPKIKRQNLPFPQQKASYEFRMIVN